MNRIDLDGRRAVVTGGGQGIGRAIAERLLASGAAVALWDRDRPLVEATRDALASQGDVLAVAVDVTDLAAVEAAARETTRGAAAASTSWSTTPASPAPTIRSGSTRRTPGAR